MGWWSATILGGDSPLDYLDHFARVLEIKNSFDIQNESNIYGYPFSKQVLDDKQNRAKLLKYINEIHDTEEKSIAYQVLGVILMSTGSKIAQKLKKEIISNTKKDRWFKTNDEERMFYINNFIDQIKKSESQPTMILNEGLFEQMNKSMIMGRKGLINKFEL